MSDKLKPCPFCGSAAEHVDSSAWVCCVGDDCLNTAASPSAEMWNTRPIEDEQAERIAHLEATYNALRAEYLDALAASQNALAAVENMAARLNAMSYLR